MRGCQRDAGAGELRLRKRRGKSLTTQLSIKDVGRIRHGSPQANLVSQVSVPCV